MLTGEGIRAMEAVQKSAEHHFLTNIQRLKSAPHGWAILYFSLSKRLTHSEILTNSSAINKYLSQRRKDAEREFEALKEEAGHIPKAVLYLFDDNDIAIVAPYKSEESKDNLKRIYKFMASRLDKGMSDFGILEHELYTYQKLADQKFLSAKRIAAYREMADRHKIASIGLRRERREHALVQVIEDDRFTASYAAGILNREYDMILSRSGEEAILHYIENAPDIVFIDIHLPGLNGHQVLNALKTIDPHVYAVMLSVDTMKDNIVKSATGGAHNFLKKPFSKERLLNIVKASPYIQGAMRRGASELPVH